MKRKIILLIKMLSKFTLYGFIVQSILCSVLLAENTKAQTSAHEIKVRIPLYNEKVADALQKIEDQTGLRFFYDKKQVNLNARVSAGRQEQSLADLLVDISRQTDLKFRKVNQDITISLREKSDKKEEVLVEEIEVSGQVKDDTGETLPGVSVLVKGSNNGTVTDVNGNYRVEVPEEAILVFSSVGFQTQEVSVNGRSVVDVNLITETQSLSEIVVVGYGTQKRVNLTGAVSQVSSEVLESRPITNLGQGLQGIIPNLNVNVNSGAPGRGATFNIRGTTSINGGEPLILVDGVVMDINLINPEDIETISVLKDAASSAIYGARAAYGVILITTKSGKKSDKPVISFSSNLSLNKPTARPEYMSSLEYANWMNAANTTTNGNDYFDEETMQHVQAYYEDPVNNESVFHHSADPSNMWRYNGNTDWTDVMLKDHYPINNYNLSVSGGGDNISYYTSLGMLDQKGLLDWFDEKYKRINILQNIKYEVTPWLELGLKATLNVADQDAIPDNKWGSFSNIDNLYMAGDSRPIMPVYHPDGHFAGYSGNGYFTNMPAFLTQGGNRKYKTNDAWITGSLKLTPLDGLTFNMNYTYNYYNQTMVHHMKEYWDYDANGPATLFPHTTPNWVRKDEEDDHYYALNIYGEYEKDFGPHYFKAMAGFNQEEKDFDFFWVRRADLISNDIPYISVASGERNGSDAGSSWSIRGGFFRLNYTYNDRYLLEVNGRYDGTSRFPSDDRFKFYPSLSAGWRISNEAFWEPLTRIFDEFKIRGSYGSLGNQSTVDDNVNGNYYPYIASYTTGEVNYLLNGAKPIAVYAPGLVSPTLTWETVNQLDFGIDFTLLRNRLSGTFDWYQRDTKDMLTKSKTMPAVLGASEPQTNAADLRTRGWEVSLSWKDQLDNQLSYGVDLMLSDYHSEITQYDNPNGIITDYYVGQSLGEIWGFETAGLFQSDDEANGYDQSQVVGHSLLAGDLKFKDLDGNSSITRGDQTLSDHGDLTIIGNNTPRYSYGVRLNSGWKNFDLSLFFQGIGKRDFYPGGTFFYSHYSSEWAVPQEFNTDYWGTNNTDAYFPRPRLNGGEIGNAQTRYLQDGSYLRCKLLSLGYTLPNTLLEKIHIDRMRVYFSGQNLFEFTQVESIFDPESDRVNMYPLNRTYSVGIDLSF